MVSMWLPPDILDMTAKSPKAYRLRNRPSVRVDAVCLHQTAYSRGNLPDLYKDVHAHFVVIPDGRVLQLHPVDAYLISSSAFNDDAIAVEFVGNFPTDRGVWWEGATYGKHKPTPEQISAGRGLVRYFNEQYGISFVFAHRQGEKLNSRGNCPGPDIWRNVGQWAVDMLGLSDGGPGYVEGHGAPIPDSWRQP